MALTKVNTDLLEDGGKLDGIEALADVTDTTNVTAAGALMDSELTSEASVKALNQGVATTDSPTFAAVTANGGVVVDNFTLDGTTLALSSGDMTLDAAGRIDLSADDSGEIRFFDGSSMYGQIKDDDDRLKIQGLISNKAMLLVGNDGGSEVTMLSLDAENAGAATFSSTVTIGSNLLAEDIKAKGSGGLTLQTDDGVKRIIIEDDGDVVINETGVDADFRVESDTNTHALFVNAGNSRVGINDDNPVNTLQITEVDDNNSNNSIYNADFSSGPMLKIANPYSGAVPSAQQTKIAGVKMVTVSNGGYGAHSQMHVESKDYAGFDAGDLVFSTGANSSSLLTERLRLNKAEAVFNDVSADVDFRVETNGSSHAFFVDGSTNNIGVSSGTEWSIVGGGNGSSSSGSSIDMGYDATIYGGSAYWAGGLDIGTNFWRDASGWHYKRTSRQATAYQQSSQGGSHAFYSQTSGNAGAVISWNNLLHMDRSQTIFNDTGADTDFRVESDNDANALFIEGGNGEVMFGKNTFGVATVGAGIRGTTGESFFSISTGNTLHVYDTSAGTFRFYVGVAGGISNYSANNVNLSDEREKKNVEALPSQWDCLKHWDLKQFHYNADDDALPKKYGVIAQEIEAHCPEVIDVFKVDDDTERMGVKEQQMMWMAIKALQEAQTRIESLESRITALES